MTTDHEMEIIQQQLIITEQERRKFWQSIGNLDPMVLSPIINPSFFGGPTWPAFRQGFVKIETPKSVILASDGLSDPYQDSAEPNQGLRIECYIESPDIEFRLDIGEIGQTWQFAIIDEIAQQFANHGGIYDLLEEYEILSMQISFPNLTLPETYMQPDGTVGVLIGMPAPNIPTYLPLPSETIRLVSIKLLTVSELNYILEQKADGREWLSEKFVELGSNHLSTIHRKSVV